MAIRALEPILEVDFRILPESQDRSKKIHSVHTDDIKSFSLENDFDIKPGTLGHGGYGEIMRAKIKSTGQSVILKKFKSYSKPQKILSEDVIKEITFLQFLNRYPQTKAVHLYGVALKDDFTQIFLVLESLEKSLDSFISDPNKKLSTTTDTSSDDDSSHDSSHDSSQSSSHDSSSHDSSNSSHDSHFSIISSNSALSSSSMQVFPPQQLKIIFYQLIKAFYYIHGLGILHNDIKLLNIMINNNDIRIIDFGISEFLGVGPCTDLVSDYICTHITKAPDSEDQKKFGYLPTNRKSYASDMYSIGCTIVQLAVKTSNKITLTKDNRICTVYSNGIIIKDLTPLLISESMFGLDGFDLLLKIMNPNTHLRWCTVNALQHTYFTGLYDNVPIDRTIIHGGNVNRLYKRQVQYTLQEYNLNQMEICYLEIQHQTYIDEIIPLEKLNEQNLGNYFLLIDWIIDVYINTNLIEGFDTFINNICIVKRLYNNIISKYGPKIQLQMLGILPTHLTRSLYNYTNKDIGHYCEISGNAFTDEEAFNFILYDLLIDNHFKLPIYPISVHIQYAYLKLKYVLQDARINSDEILEKLFVHICLHVIFWIMQPEPFSEPVSIWEIVIYATNRSLSIILDIPLFDINIQPFLNFLTLEDKKYNAMNIYFQSRFENAIILHKLKQIKIIESIFLKTLNPREKLSLFQK
jgi:serine/threonine protein kinase